jgi:hypothetical protein
MSIRRQVHILSHQTVGQLGSVFQQPAGDIDAKPTVGRSEALHVNRRTGTRSKSKLDRYRIPNWLGDIGRADQFNHGRSRQVAWSGHLGSGAVARIFLGSYEVPLRLSDGRDSQHDGREQPAETKVYTASSDHHAFSNIMALIDSLALTAFGQGHLVFWCKACRCQRELSFKSLVADGRGDIPVICGSVAPTAVHV